MSTLTTARGDTYVGDVLDGRPNGEGSFTFSIPGRAGTARYEGEWREGKLHGFGIMTLPSGILYVGNFVDGKRQGEGAYLHISGRPLKRRRKI